MKPIALLLLTAMIQSSQKLPTERCETRVYILRENDKGELIAEYRYVTPDAGFVMTGRIQNVTATMTCAAK